MKRVYTVEYIEVTQAGERIGKVGFMSTGISLAYDADECFIGSFDDKDRAIDAVVSVVDDRVPKTKQSIVRVEDRGA